MDIGFHQPVNEHEASEEVQQIYAAIKSTFKLPYVPVFFKYLANFQPFFSHIWQSLQKNIQDPKFGIISNSLERDILDIGNTLYKGTTTSYASINLLPDQITRQRIAHELSDLFSIQCQLAYLSIAIREATKGWAVGAQYLTSEQAFHTMPETREPGLDSEIKEIILADSTSALAAQHVIDQSLLTFLVLLNEEFAAATHRDEYIFARVAIEKAFYSRVQDMPHPIRASYNQVAKLVMNIDELPSLFYLLSERFPVVHAVASLMWGFGISSVSSRSD